MNVRIFKKEKKKKRKKRKKRKKQKKENKRSGIRRNKWTTPSSRF
jgi:hypothetical protein